MKKPKNARELFYPLKTRLNNIPLDQENKTSYQRDQRQLISDLKNGLMWFPPKKVLAEIDIVLDKVERLIGMRETITDNFEEYIEKISISLQRNEEGFHIKPGGDPEAVPITKIFYASIEAELNYYRDILIRMKEELLRSLGAHVKRTNTRTEKVKGLDLQLKKGKTINDFKQALEKFIHEDTEEDHITSIFFSNKFLSDERIIWKHREKSPEIIQQSLIALLDAMASKKNPQPSLKEALNAYCIFFKRPLDKGINKHGEIINISEDTISKYHKVEKEKPDKYLIKSIVNEFVE